MSEGEFLENLGRWYRQMFAVAVCSLGNPADAEDAVQDTALNAYRNYSGFRGESSIPTWMFRILRNVIHDIYRKRGGVTFVGLEDLEWLPGNSFSPEKRAIVMQAVSKLPEKQRETLFLWLAGLSHGEIAEALRVEDGTARSNLYRANQKVREFFTGKGY